MTLQTIPTKADQFTGPFLGLNTTMDSSQLTQSYATKCSNIILSDGKIRIREPWRKWTTATVTNPIEGKKIVSMMSLKIPQTGGSEFKSIMLIHTSDAGGGLGELWRWVEGKDPNLLTNQLRTFPSQFVLYNGYVYILGGGSNTGFNWMTDGTVENTHQMGMRSPDRGGNSGAPSDYFPTVTSVSAGTGIGSNVQYAVTLLDDISGREGNPTITPIFNVSLGHGVNFLIPSGGFVRPAYWNEKQIRIYRRNHTIGQVGYRLVKQLNYPPQGTAINFLDSSTEAQLDASGISNADISSSEAGPFAPSRNGFASLRGANMGAIFRDRLFYNDQGNDRIVRFSQIGAPFHVDPDDFFTLDGDADEIIQGIASLGNFLIVGKKRAIWSISGETNTPTNIDNATGVKGLEDLTVVQRIPTNVGPSVERLGVNNGNGFFIGGEPARLYFVNDAGFFSFDGISVTSLTDLIKPTWHQFVFLNPGNATPHYSFADDPQNGVIYIVNFNAKFGLAYHYRLSRAGIPVWSTIDGGDVVLDGDKVIPFVFEALSGFASSDAAGVQSYVPLMVGDTRGRVYEADPNDILAPVPNFEWASGQLPAIRGLQAHVYFARFFLTTKAQPLPGDQTNPSMRFSLIPDGDSSRETSLFASLNNRNRVILNVRRKMARLQISISKSNLWQFGWSEKFGILGWDIDAELVGQR